MQLDQGCGTSPNFGGAKRQTDKFPNLNLIARHDTSGPKFCGTSGCVFFFWSRRHADNGGGGPGGGGGGSHFMVAGKGAGREGAPISPKDKAPSPPSPLPPMKYCGWLTSKSASEAPPKSETQRNDLVPGEEKNNSKRCGFPGFQSGANWNLQPSTVLHNPFAAPKPKNEESQKDKNNKT